ncbi:hypothetical protein Nepgr_002296 [Nepenthes gracilis]|uniref:non-specific serine/threonine protein kinase n=1 Tax=Nepenthes gracilis TaxID=150966 RepID=A0AAD3P9T4_NEPGR|nr:hypothetical protein Nepgr_002296 [Nepenthes gracilis]
MCGNSEYFAMKAMNTNVTLNYNSVHRVYTERKILDMLNLHFLPMLYASFQAAPLYDLEEGANGRHKARAHPWLHNENHPIPLDIFIYKIVKSYVHATPFKRAALKALSKALTEDELM